MLKSNGWAALWALVVLSFGCFGSAQASNGAPTIACFSPANAAQIGSFGPESPDVVHAFELGACVALAPGIPIGQVSRQGDLFRFQIQGSQYALYAPSWGAGFAGVADDGRNRSFARFVPVTARLLAVARAFVQCYDAYLDLAKRWDNWEARWAAYQRWGGRPLSEGAMVTRVYLANTGPKLVAEREALRATAMKLDRKCSGIQNLELDRDFIGFARTLSV